MYCCINCFLDNTIVEFIKDYETSGTCDYCGTKRINIAPLEDVSDLVKEGFFKKYEDDNLEWYKIFKDKIIYDEQYL